MSALTDARAAIGELSNPSKMPCRAWNISAHDCKTGAKLRDIENSTCAGCYALKNRYLFGNVQGALNRRLLAYSTDPKKWANNMIIAINNAPYFRWFDSGDLQSVEMLARIVDICRATPKTMHWLATREKATVREYVRAHGPLP